MSHVIVWSRDIVCSSIYIILSTVSFLDLTDANFFCKVSFFCIHYHFFKYILYVCYVFNQGDLHTTDDDSDLICVHTRVWVGPTSHKSYSITNWCE